MASTMENNFDWSVGGWTSQALPNLDTAARPVVDSRGGHREQFAVSARRPAT